MPRRTNSRTHGFFLFNAPSQSLRIVAHVVQISSSATELPSEKLNVYRIINIETFFLIFFTKTLTLTGNTYLTGIGILATVCGMQRIQGFGVAFN